MLTPPSLHPLVPLQYKMQNGNTLYYFKNPSLELVKLDFTFEAGSAYQQFMSQAHAANQLFGEATVKHSAAEVAEFMDFRGIVMERMADITQGNVSFYFLRKYAEELLPLIREMFDQPAVTPQLFDAYVSQRRLKIAQGFQQTNYLARNAFYEQLYGFDSPMGKYAEASDLDQLTLDAVVRYMEQHYRLGNAHIVLAGNVDEELLAISDTYFGTSQALDHQLPYVVEKPNSLPAELRQHVVLPSAVQSSLRIGCVLPMAWDSLEYAQFMVLCTVLGGYFGSRLMSNIREDKGYTYGIYSQTQMFRGSIVFYITADVAAEATEPAVNEVLFELQRLKDELVGEEELERVRNVMMGDFIRNIDGTFEISERYRQMVCNNITDRFAENYLDAVQNITSQQLQQLAQRYFCNLLIVTAGPALNKNN